MRSSVWFNDWHTLPRRPLIDASDAWHHLFLYKKSVLTAAMAMSLPSGGPVLPEASQLVAQFSDCRWRRGRLRGWLALSWHPNWEWFFRGAKRTHAPIRRRYWHGLHPVIKKVAKTNMTFDESWQSDRTVVDPRHVGAASGWMAARSKTFDSSIALK
jgi:hypothetical protein